MISPAGRGGSLRCTHSRPGGGARTSEPINSPCCMLIPSAPPQADIAVPEILNGAPMLQTSRGTNQPGDGSRQFRALARAGSGANPGRSAAWTNGRKTGTRGVGRSGEFAALLGTPQPAGPGEFEALAPAESSRRRRPLCRRPCRGPRCFGIRIGCRGGAVHAVTGAGPGIDARTVGVGEALVLVLLLLQESRVLVDVPGARRSSLHVGVGDRRGPSGE